MTDKDLRKRLRKVASQFQISDFRPGQEDTMLYVLRGEDTLAIMPTGAGKSLCYQIPAQIKTGTTIVVSPLISLMKDQHKKILDLGFISQHLSSELTRKQTENAIQRLGEGKMDIQFVTPEKLENPDVLAAFRKAGVSLFVVDEAHCISEWGHDFRPAYLTLSKALEALGHPTVLALTATATPEVTRDIQSRLHFKTGSHVVRISYRRDNLLLRAREFQNEDEKFQALLKILWRLGESGEPSGIVYCASVKQTEWLTHALRKLGFRAARYHGRMKKNERRRAHERFMNTQGIIMIATSAFGMGIDKPDVRFVINYQIPSSIESYYQEMGRAGRDGRKSYAFMFYTHRDKALQRVLQIRKYPNIEHVARAIEALFPHEILGEMDQTALEAEVGKKKLGIILKMLEGYGFIESDGRRIRPLRKPTSEELSMMLLNWEERKSDDRARLDEVVRYVHTNLCRWYYLLRYFGEDLAEPCGLCDNCRKYQKSTKLAELRSQVKVEPQYQTQAAQAQSHLNLGPSPLHLSNFNKGDHVQHSQWGIGEVMQKIGPNLRVFFPGVGEKTLREDFLTPWSGGVAQGPSTKKVA